MDKQDLQVDVEVYPESSRSSQEVAVPIPLTRRGKSRRKKVVRAKKRGQYKPRDKSAQSAPSEAGTVHAYEDSSNQDFEHSYAGPGEGPSSSSAHFETLDQQACSSQCVTSQNECDTYSHSMSTNMDLQDFAAGNEHVSKNDDKVDGNGCEANINKEHVSCPPATILSDTLASLTELVPDDWVVIADGKGFHFLKLSVSTFKAIQREIYIMYNGITSVAVHGVALSESSDFMKVVSDPVPFKEDHYSSFCERALTLCWEIEQYLVCAGADFEEAKNRWSEIPDTYIDLNPFQELTYTSSCRSNNCHRIIPLRFNSYRCTECQKIMKKIKERFKFSEKEDISEDIPNRNLTNKQVRDKLTEVTKKFRKSERRASYLQSKIKNLDVLLVNEGVDVVEEDSKFFANILEKSNLSEMQQIFLEQQFKYATASNPRAHRWHPALIRLAIRIRSQSSAAYETLRDSGAVMLPHSRTLFDYTHYIKEQVGINKDLLKMLAEDKDRQDKPENQYHALIFDEVYVSQNLVYRKSDGALLGYVYLDEVDKEIQRFDAFLDGKAEMSELPLASTVLAFMVKGLISNVKSVVASYPCKNLNKSIISARVWDVVSQCEGAGIKILALVCDGSPNNRAFFKLHTPITPVNETDTGIVFDTLNIFSEDERPLFFIADVAHLLKTIRNCLYNSREGQGDRFRCMQVKGEKLLWKTIVRLYYATRNDTLRECWKLNAQNVFPNSYSTMRVKYAAEVLSQSVANALKNLNWQGTQETINFIEKINKFFDILNGAHSSQCIKQLKPDLAPYRSEDDPRFIWLQKDFWKDYLIEWKRNNEIEFSGLPQKNLSKSMLADQTLEGIEISIRGFTAATKWLLHPEKGKASFVMARAFSQDPLEQHFSQQRGALGGSTNPNTQQFMRTQISIALQGKLKTRRRKANVEDDLTPSEVSHEPLPKLKRKKTSHS